LPPSAAPCRPLPPLAVLSALQTLPEEPDHVAPRAVRDLGPLARAQEPVADAGMDRVVVALVVGPDRRVHIRQPGIDARVVLGVHAQAAGADAGHGERLGAGAVADDEARERGVVRGVAEALAAAPAEPDHADAVGPRRLQAPYVRHRGVEILSDRVGGEPRDELARRVGGRRRTAPA